MSASSPGPAAQPGGIDEFVIKGGRIAVQVVYMGAPPMPRPYARVTIPLARRVVY